MSKKFNPSSIKGLVKNLSENYDKEYEPIVQDAMSPESPEGNVLPPVESKDKKEKHTETTGLYVRLPKSLAVKLRSLADKEGFTVKEIIVESLTNTISRYEKQFGELMEQHKPKPRNLKDVIQ